MAHHLTVEAQSRMEAAVEEKRLELANLYSKPSQHAELARASSLAVAGFSK